MGTENRALVGDALELVVAGVGPHLDRMLSDHVGARDVDAGPVADRDLVSMLGMLVEAPTSSAEGATANLLAGYARELQSVWDAWARIRPFDAAETYRALDTAARLLQTVGAEDEASIVRELATVPLALFAARVLAEYVADDTPAVDESAVPEDEPSAPEDASVVDAAGDEDGDDLSRPVRLRAVNHPRHAERVEDARAPASIRALRAVDPALPLVTWSELSDTITALLATGRLDPQVLAGFTRRSLDERARAAVSGASGRGVTIRPEHVAWVVSVLRARYAGTARVTRAAATALVAEYIAELAPRAGVDPRRVRQDMMAWVDVERA